MRKLFLSAAAFALLTGPALAQSQETAAVDPASIGDVAAGEKVWKKCQACHVFDSDKKKIGPHLMGLFGRPAGSVEGFKYSKGLQEKAAEIGNWDVAKLDAWLEDPSKFIGKRSKMILKLKKAEDRANVLAFLAANTKPAE